VNTFFSALTELEDDNRVERLVAIRDHALLKRFFVRGRE